MMDTAAEYEAKAAEALVLLAEAKTEAERYRLRRAHGVYRKLARNVAESAARIAARPPVAPHTPKRPGGTGLFK